MAAMSKNSPNHFYFWLPFRKYICYRGFDIKSVKIAIFHHFSRWRPKFNMEAISKNFPVHFHFRLPFRKYINCRGFDVKLAKIANFQYYSRWLPKFSMAAISKNVQVHFHFRLPFRKYIYFRGFEFAPYFKMAAKIQYGVHIQKFPTSLPFLITFQKIYILQGFGCKIS